MVDKIVDDKKVTRIAHRFDDLELLLETGLIADLAVLEILFTLMTGKTPLQPFPGQFLQVTV
jgi:hypothetical protein